LQLTGDTMFGAHRGQHGALPPLLLAERRRRGVYKKVESVPDRPLALCRGSGAALAKPGSGQTVDSVNIPARELGTRPYTRATTNSHEGTTRPAEALCEALRPRRSQTTPPRPRGLHPAGALARTHRNKNATEKGWSPCKKVRQKASKRVLTLPSRLGGYCRGP
jgi:hypothetical protein